MASDESIWSYSPSYALAVTSAVFYFIPTVILAWQTLFKYRSWFFVCVIIGSAIEVGGYACRAVATKRLNEIPPYAISACLIIIAPVFVAAGNYLLIGRLIRAVLPPTRHRIFLIPAHLITRIFVCFDVFTFLVQGSGSSIAGDWKGNKAKIGKNVIIGGLGLQAATFTWFLSIVFRFWRVTRWVERQDAPAAWRGVLHAIWVSSSLILVRSLFRLIEFALGIEGYPFTHEWMFYIFEALPMLIAITVFCLVPPGKYLGGKGGLDQMEGSESGVQLDGICVADAAGGRRFSRERK